MGFGHALTIAALALLTCQVARAYNPDDITWKETERQNGIVIWRGQVPGSPLFGFKGKQTMQIPVEKLAWVISNKDIESKRRWVHMVMDFIISESDGKMWAYASYDLPWPARNRDFITEVKIDIRPDERRFKMVLGSVTSHDLYPESQSVGVRAWLDLLRYDLVAVGANETEVTVEAWVDPRGLLPAWIVNYIASSWPEKTLSGLYREARRPDTKSYEGLPGLFAPSVKATQVRTD